MLFKTNEIVEFGGLFVGHYVLPVAARAGACVCEHS